MTAVPTLFAACDQADPSGKGRSPMGTTAFQFPTAAEWAKLDEFNFRLHPMLVALSKNAKGHAVQYFTAKGGESVTAAPTRRPRTNREFLQRVIEIRDQ